jgi:LysR family transcriptional activator of nhaA
MAHRISKTRIEASRRLFAHEGSDMQHTSTPEREQPVALSNERLNFKHLFYFHVVAEEGSLVKAARRLGVTEPSISEQIKKLEIAFGRRLFDRTSSGLRLNDAGRAVYEHTSVMFLASARLARRFSPSQQEQPVVLEVGIAGSVSRAFAASYFLPLVKFDGALVRMRIGENNDLMNAVTAHELDLVLTDAVPNRPEPTKLRVQKVQEPKAIVIAGEKLAAEVNDFPKDLTGKPFIHYTRQSRFHAEIEHYFERTSITTKLVAEADDISLHVAAVAGEGCFGVVPETAARREIQAGTIRKLGDAEGVDASVYAVYHDVATPELIEQAIGLLRRPIE